MSALLITFLILISRSIIFDSGLLSKPIVKKHPKKEFHHNKVKPRNQRTHSVLEESIITEEESTSPLALVSLDHKSLQDRTNLKILPRVRLSMQFDIEIIKESFTQCYDKELDIEQYNKGYDELYKFFGIIGTVFSFIASDVREKIDILENYRKDEKKKENYEQIEAMMLHEIDVNKRTGNELHGSRTLLRLHRALLFTMYFLERLIELQPNDKTSTMALDAYKDSLANHHPWLIRNGAKVAMYTLPYKKDFMKKIVSPDIDDNTVKQIVTETVASMRKVYDKTEELYTKYDLHGLP